MVANSQHEAAAAPAANATTDAAAGGAATPSQKRDVYVTGFGKFGDILENPTTFLATKLAEHPNVTESHVLEVSAESCVEELADMYARAEERGRPCIFLHFGVSAISRTLKLEQVGYNMADFRIPDERGYVAKDETIHEGEPDEIATKLPLEEMLKTLQAVHPRVALSTDPGRYICNYVYYQSLVWVKRQEAKGHSEHLALFVHVPEFRNVVFEDQLALASKLVDLVANQ
ncbi:G protein-activated inward rectifier potassium channel 2 [Phytophthora pseudosyringae]|uniref:G protein-activated inward rectifier potassium channel 2 n=1 Tax=Phytophthora pseudosyringae TaxID=221518 RepID=A0A8T1V8G1_9STRA|nr:G protein-activated inward rectifier potassium channel 2 [Phytophthora pseudosyringae]